MCVYIHYSCINFQCNFCKGKYMNNICNYFVWPVWPTMRHASTVKDYKQSNGFIFTNKFCPILFCLSFTSCWRVSPMGTVCYIPCSATVKSIHFGVLYNSDVSCLLQLNSLKYAHHSKILSRYSHTWCTLTNLHTYIQFGFGEQFCAFEAPTPKLESPVSLYCQSVRYSSVRLQALSRVP